MNDDEYFARARDPAPPTVVEAANQGLAKRKRERIRTVDSDLRGLRLLSWLWCWPWDWS
jgi:hypothetical protein